MDVFSPFTFTPSFKSPSILSPFAAFDGSANGLDYFSLTQDQTSRSTSSLKDVSSFLQGFEGLDDQQDCTLRLSGKRSFDQVEADAAELKEEQQEFYSENLILEDSFLEELLEGKLPTTTTTTTTAFSAAPEQQQQQLDKETQQELSDLLAPFDFVLDDEAAATTSFLYTPPESSSPASSPEPSSPMSSPVSSPLALDQILPGESPAAGATAASTSSSSSRAARVTRSAARPAKRARRSPAFDDTSDSEQPKSRERVIHRRRPRKPREAAASPNGSSSSEETEAKPKKVSKTGRTGGCKGDDGSPFASNFRLQVGPNQVSVLVLRHQGNNGAHPKNKGYFYFQARIRNVYPQRHLWAGWETHEGMEARIRSMLEDKKG